MQQFIPRVASAAFLSTPSFSRHDVVHTEQGAREQTYTFDTWLCVHMDRKR